MGGLSATGAAAKTFHGYLRTRAAPITLGAITLSGNFALDTTDNENPSYLGGANITIGGVTDSATSALLVNSGTAGDFIQSGGTIVADRLRIIANGNIGSSFASPLNLDVNYFEARSYSSTIFASNDGHLTLGFTGGAFEGLIDGALQVAGTNAIGVQSDDLDIDQRVRGTGALTLQPRAGGSTVSIGTTGGAFALDDADLNNLTNGFAYRFTGITLGRDNSAAVTVDTATFDDPVTLLGGATITVNAGAPSLRTSATSGAGITITASAGAGVIVNGGINADGAGGVDLNSGAAFSLANGVAIASDSGVITIDTTGANDDMTLDGSIASGGAGTVTLTASRSIIMDADSSIVTATGPLVLDADASGTGSLKLDVVQSTGGAQITLRAGTTGSITEADDTALISTAGLLFINDAAAGSAVGAGGAGQALNTSVGSIRIAATGSVYIDEVDALAIGDGTAGVSTSGGLIDIVAGGAVTVVNPVTTGAGGNSISIQGTAIDIGANIVSTSSNQISLTATSGAITRSAGTITTAAGTLVLSAGSSIGVDAGSDGAADASWIVTTVATLRATAGNGGIFVNEANGLALGNGAGGVSSTNGDILITAGGALTTGNSLTASGTGADIVLNAGGTITLSNNVAAAVAATFDAAGTITVNGGTLTGGTGLVLFNDPVVHSGGTIVAGPVAVGSEALRFAGNYTGTGGTLVGNGSTNPDIAFQGNVVLGTYAHNGDRFRFYGNAAQSFTTSGQILSGVRVEKSGGSIGLASDAVQTAGGILSFNCTAPVAFNLNGNSWTLGAASDVNSNITLNVNAGTLDGTRALTVSGTGVLSHASGTLDLASLTHTSTGASVLGTGPISVTGAIGVSAGSLTQTGNNGANAQQAGSISVTGGSLAWDTADDGGSLAVAGQIAASAGSLSLNAKTVTAGTIAVTGSADLDLGTAAITLNGASGANTINTTGSIVDGGSSLTMNGANASLVLDADERIGDLIVNATGISLTDSGAAVDVDLFTVTAAGGATIVAGTLHVNGTTGIAGALSATGAASLTSGGALTVSGAGSISMAAGTLTVNAGGMSLTGTGSVTSAGTATDAIAVTGSLAWTGSSSALTITGTGALNVSGNLTMDATSSGDLSAGAGGILIGGNLVQSAAGNGDILSAGDVSVSGQLTSFSLLRLTGADLTVSGTGANTNSGTIETLTSGTQTYAGTVTNMGTITGYDLVTFNADVNGTGTINAGPVAAGSPAIRFAADYDGSGGTLVGDATAPLTGPDIEFQGDVVIGTFTHNGDRVVFSGTVPATTFNSNGQYLADVQVNKVDATDLVRLVGSTVTQNGTTLEIGRGILDLDIYYWLSDPLLTAPLPTAGSFLGRSGATLAFGPEAELRCVDFTSEAGHTVANPTVTPGAVITASGNVAIAGPNGEFTDPDNSTLVMTGTATLNAEPEIGNLSVGDDAGAAGSVVVTLARALQLAGSVHIYSDGVLDVDPADYALEVGGNWTNEPGNPGFVAQEGTVTFTGAAVDIVGSTTWYRFVYEIAGGTIRFSNNPDRQTVLSVFRVYSAGTDITLTKLTANGNPSLPQPVFPADAGFFWDISVLPGAVIEMHNVQVFYSNAATDPIIAPDTSVKVTPYSPNLPTEPVGHYNYKWLQGLVMVYSYTEDSDRNGRIDRIRVQTAAAVGNDFSGFTVSVEGYAVTGYSRPVAGSNFYIHLQEKTLPDTEATPKWTVVGTNTTLADAATGTKLASVWEEPMEPVDTAQPRIDYTLALPGRNQVFVSLSEPIFDAGSAITFTTSVTPVDSASPIAATGGETEYLLDTAAAFDVATIAAGTATVSVANARDDAAEATDVFSASLPAPTYPTAYGIYAAYDVAPAHGGVGLAPPNLVTDTPPAPPFPAATHRISDLLISVPPASGTDANYFVWPIWAKDSVITEIGPEEYENLTPEEAASLTIGLIRDFTGTRWLRDQDITLQARVNAALGTPSALRLHFDANVSDASMATAAHGPTGLWLPTFSESAFSNIVPAPRSGTSKASATSPTAPLLWNLEIDADDPKIKSVSTIGFYFTLGAENTVDPLYAARLDFKTGNPVPDDWYRRIKPFTFAIHDVKQQRSAVTILNNVINPEKGERVRISYQLRKGGATVIQVFTLDGDLVDVLYRGTRAAGDYTASWDGKNRGGRSVARGMYFVRVVGPEIDEIRKVMVVK